MLPKTKQILLTAPKFLGDEVVFTGAVREIKLATGWDVRVSTGNPSLWDGNQSISGIGDSGEEDVIVSRHCCPAFRGSGANPVHFLEQYVKNLRAELNLTEPYKKISKFGGEVQVTDQEIAPLVADQYWIIGAGYNTDVPTKGWPSQRYQEVVDSLRGRITFVQVGTRRDWHPPLRGVIDMVGKTSVRDLVRLVYHAEGIVCPITSLMHLAAAVPMPPNSRFKIRPCVVIAGGREAVHFINYPTHKVLNTVGTLSCCATDGCGFSRFGDQGCKRQEMVRSEGAVPKCMTLITAADVTTSIEFYYRGDIRIPRSLGRTRAVFEHLQRDHNGPEIHGAEIGVKEGEMSSQLLRGHLGLHLTMVDQWLSDPAQKADNTFYSRTQEHFDRDKAIAMRVTDFAAARRTVIHNPSVEAAQGVPDKSLDFVFIDANHVYEACCRDIEAWYPKLKPGGILCGHDYFRPHWPDEGVQRAVDEFVKSTSSKLEISGDNTWFIHFKGQENVFRPL